MLCKAFSYKNTNKQFVLRKRYSHIPPLQNFQINDHTIKLYPNNLTAQEPILNYDPHQRVNVSINENILMQSHDEFDEELSSEILLEEDDGNYTDTFLNNI